MELTRQKPNPSPQNRLSRLRETKTAPSVGAVSPHRCWHRGQWRPGQTTGVDGGRHAHWDLPEVPPSPWVPECWSRRDTSATQWHLPRPRPQQTAAKQRACVRAGAPCSECALRGAAWRASLALFVLLPSGARPTRPTLGEAALVPACALRAAEGPMRDAACADPGTAIVPRCPHGTDGQSSEVPGDGYCILVSSSQRPGFCHVQGQTLAFPDCIRGSPSGSAPVLQRIEKKVANHFSDKDLASKLFKGPFIISSGTQNKDLKGHDPGG